jgi:hypothetical protein
VALVTAQRDRLRPGHVQLPQTSASLGGDAANDAACEGQEPSMEEILASIRRIIADDEPAKETTERRQESLPAARESPAAPPEMAPPPMTPPPPRITPAAAAASAPPKTDEEIDSMLAHLRGASRQPPPRARSRG